MILPETISSIGMTRERLTVFISDATLKPKDFNLSENDSVKIGDIVVFKSEEGSLSRQGYVLHRIIEQTEDGDFITKGDANDYKDPLLKREWIQVKENIKL